MTAIDKLAIHYSPEEAKEFTSRILNSINPYQEFDIKDQRKHKKEARITELKEAFENLPTKIAYRPFDIRYMYYTKKTECWINSPRYENMKHMFHDKNLCLLLPKAFCDKEFAHVFISNSITEAIFLSGTTGSNAMCSPLYLYSDSETLDGTTKTPNLDATIWMKISGSVGRETTPEEVLDYIYAVLHSPKYREKYREFLKIDFPRVPYPTSRESFEALVKLGGELRGLHLLESPKVQEYITTFPIAGSGEVEKVTVQDSPLEGSPKAGVDISDDPSWAKNSLFLYWSLPKNKELIDRAKVLRKQ